MRNTPLWRPQPSLTPGTGDLTSEPSEKRTSAFVLAGLGLALAGGVGTVGLFAFVDDDQAAPVADAVQPKPAIAVQAPIENAGPNARVGLPEVAKRAPLPAAGNSFAATPSPKLELRGTASAQPAVETIDVAVAESEFDIARLEEMTGMVEPAKPEPVAPTAEEAARVTATVGATADAEVEAPIESNTAASPVAPDATAPDPAIAATQPTEADDGTETASIVPGAPVESEQKPSTQVASPLPALGAAKVSRYVNLRSGPADEAGVVTIVPAGATVQAQAD